MRKIIKYKRLLLSKCYLSEKDLDKIYIEYLDENNTKKTKTIKCVIDDFNINYKKKEIEYWE